MDSIQRHYAKLEKSDTKEYKLLSRIIKDLRLNAACKLVSFRFAGIRQETAGWKTKDFITHSDRISQNITLAQ